MTARDGETGRAWFRTDRFIHTCTPNNAWYVTLREGGMLGPFETRRDAEVELFIALRHQGVKLAHMDEDDLDLDWFQPSR